MAAAEGDVALEVVKVSLRTKELEDGRDFTAINPLGQVSTLQLPGGVILTETSAILMWVQGQSQKSDFYRAPDHDDYFQILRWTSFTATELHKAILRIVFYDEATDAGKDRFRATGRQRLAVVNAHLDGREFMVGASFSAADAYLTWALNLLPKAGVPLDEFPNLLRFQNAMTSRPAIADVIAQDQAS